MSREQTFANAGWARAFQVLAPPFEDKTLQVDLDTLVSVLESLPGYAEFTLTLHFGNDDRTQRTVLMARDIAGPGRRFTSLTHGTEWFDIGAILRASSAQFVFAAPHPADQEQSVWVSL